MGFSKGNEVTPLGNQFVPFRMDPFREKRSPWEPIQSVQSKALFRRRGGGRGGGGANSFS